MAGCSSGIPATEECLKLAAEFKTHRSETQKDKKIFGFKIVTDDSKPKKTHFIDIDENLNVENAADLIRHDDVNEDKVPTFLPNEPRYILADLAVVSGDGRESDELIFIAWCPDDCNVKQRMLFASSRNDFSNTLHTKLQGGFKTRLNVGTVKELIKELSDKNCLICKDC